MFFVVVVFFPVSFIYLFCLFFFRYIFVYLLVWIVRFCCCCCCSVFQFFLFFTSLSLYHYFLLYTVWTLSIKFFICITWLKELFFLFSWIANNKIMINFYYRYYQEHLHHDWIDCNKQKTITNQCCCHSIYSIFSIKLIFFFLWLK